MGRGGEREMWAGGWVGAGKEPHSPRRHMPKAPKSPRTHPAPEHSFPQIRKKFQKNLKLLRFCNCYFLKFVIQ